MRRRTSPRYHVAVIATHANATRLVLCLAEAGHCVSVIGSRLFNNDLSFSPNCRQFVPISRSLYRSVDDAEVLAILERELAAMGVEVVLASGLESSHYLARLTARNPRFLPSMPVAKPDTIDALHDKSQFARFCSEEGLPHPHTYLLEDLTYLDKGTLPIPFPLLTKPLARAGGTGIHRFEDLDSLRTYLSDTDQRYNQLPVILQEFIDGDDIDFNGFAVGGEIVAWSIQRHIVCEGAPGSKLSGRQFVCEERVFELGRRIVRAADYEGPLHVDMRISRHTGKLYAIEMNPRFWESIIASLCDGINFGDVAVQAALNANCRWTPNCSGTIWGNPKAALKNWLCNRNRTAFNYLRHHCLFQLRHILHQKKIASHLALNRYYDPSFQAEIVELIHDTGLPLQQAARQFNVTQELLEQWLTTAATE